MSFPAKFRGRCAECDGPIEVDQLIESFRHLDGSHGFAHVHCPDDPDEVADAAALAQPVCGRCFTHHPGEC